MEEQEQKQSLSKLRDAFKDAGFTVKKVNDQEKKYKIYKIYDGKVETGHLLIDQKDSVQVSLFMNPSLRVTFHATFAPVVEKGENISFGIYSVASLYSKIEQKEPETPTKPKSNLIGLNGEVLESGQA